MLGKGLRGKKSARGVLCCEGRCHEPDYINLGKKCMKIKKIKEV